MYLDAGRRERKWNPKAAHKKKKLLEFGKSCDPAPFH